MRRALVLAIFVAACGGDRAGAPEPAAPRPEPPADALVHDHDAGAVRVTVQVWPRTPTLGDSIWLRLEVVARPGVTVELPFDQAALGRFAVLGYTPERGRTDDGGERRTDTYELAAPMSGRHRLPPLRVVARDPAAGEVEVLTDEIPLEVGAVLADKTDRELRPARGLVETHVGGGVWWSLVAAGTGAVGAVAAILAWQLMRRRAVRRGQVSAWELAMRRLAELQARGAPAADQADAWFVELSGVVRGYVEGRFRLRAPELTTEEFLLEARRIEALTAAHRELLGSFLERCDRVKFAGWRPDAEASIEVLDAARAFIDDTRLREPASGEVPPARVASEAVS